MGTRAAAAGFLASREQGGAYDNSIAVGSVTESKRRSSFSDGGPELDAVEVQQMVHDSGQRVRV